MAKDTSAAKRNFAHESVKKTRTYVVGGVGFREAPCEEKKLDSATLTHRIAEVALERKALDLVVIDVRGRSSYTDFIILASGTSDRHVQSIAELADTTLRHEGVGSISREGMREGQWALIDFGAVVLHVFHQFTRELYDLEDMWRDAPRVTGLANSAAVAPSPGASAAL